MNVDPSIREAAFVVEATQFEKHCLWDRNDRDPRVKWEEITVGTMPTVGSFAGHPVVLSIFFAKLDGKLVAFYEACSAVVDHRMVEAWMGENSPAYAAGRRCNALNFIHCVQWVKESSSR